ncbi:MAG: NADAR family protein [Labilithrix sp.]
MLWTRASLTAHLAAGHPIDFLLFWGHTPKLPGAVDKSCLSQWFPASFVLDGVTYRTAEHFMMAEKARLFRDDDALRVILEAATPADAKKAGRAVRGYDDQAWGKQRSLSVVKGNVAKFDQNEAMGAFLRSTGDSILVECSPRDRIWGIGMGASNPDARDPSKWRGQNLLGFALVAARAELRGA